MLDPSAIKGQTGVMLSSCDRPLDGSGIAVWIVGSVTIRAGIGTRFRFGRGTELSGFRHEGFDRFKSKAWNRIDVVLEGQTAAGPCGYVPGNVVAQDIDADGDIDLLYNRRIQAPVLYLNDGQGHFTAVDDALPGLVDGRELYAMALVDVTGDDLPELWATGVGMAMWSENHGNLDFGEWNFVYWDDEYPMDCHPSLSLDFDGDGDSDYPARSG